MYHHCRPLESIVYGDVKANPEHAAPEHIQPFNWLEKEVGFYPLFLAVGKTIDDIYITGYANNWYRKIREWMEDGKSKSELRKAGEFPNNVLFSFDDVDGVFMDYMNWHIVLNSRYNNYQITDREKRLIFKYSWSKSKWLKKAKDDPQSVQLVSPRLNLSEAKQIWVRNKETKKVLEHMGFGSVEVKRIPVRKL